MGIRGRPANQPEFRFTYSAGKYYDTLLHRGTSGKNILKDVKAGARIWNKEINRESTQKYLQYMGARMPGGFQFCRHIGGKIWCTKYKKLTLLPEVIQRIVQEGARIWCRVDRGDITLEVISRYLSYQHYDECKLKSLGELRTIFKGCVPVPSIYTQLVARTRAQAQNKERPPKG